MNVSDDAIMRFALALAERGRGSVEPNPLVGALVFDASGASVGSGFHEQFGGPHAEIHALAEAGDCARGGTLYVTLEPCSHFGKTGPCVDAVLRAGVARVVVAMVDPFPKVAGSGIAKLRESGIEVVVGVAEREARRLNAPFIKRVTTGRPWVIAKWAMSLDGKIATRTGDSRWISGEESRQRVHERRGTLDAILIGAETLRRDNPLLTARPRGKRIPTRVVITRSGVLPSQCQLLGTLDQAPVLVVVPKGNEGQLEQWKRAGAEILTVSGDLLPALLDTLGQRGMSNILVEGGSQLLGSFFDAQLVDEAEVYVAPKVIGGTEALAPVGGKGIDFLKAALLATDQAVTPCGSDFVIQAYFR